MSALVWLDVPLFGLGLLAMSPWLWNCFRRRQFSSPSALSRVLRTATLLLFFLGLGSLTMAGVDVALSEWEKAHRPSGDWIGETMMAPDFRLPALDEDRTVRLGDFRGHTPVVLIFGSFG